VTSNNHWRRFCESFARPDLLADSRLDTNEKRVAARDWLIPIVAAELARYDKADIAAKCEAAQIPFAPVARVGDLFTDPQLEAGGGLLDVTLPGGLRTRLPALPIEMDGRRTGLRADPPETGEESRAVLAQAGLSDAEIAALIADGTVRDGGA
jgi:crotonobetainyl-CoA:carnitine CoA-transferase CaiB-like acyl-CoA transferase